MVLLIITLPLIGFLLTALFARFIGRKGSVLLTTIIMFVNIILTVLLFYEISFKQKLIFIKIATWIYSDTLHIDWGFYVDNLTLVMLFVVNTISALVHLYSADYMLNDPHLPRFMSYLSLFTFFMLLLITGDNLVILFLGWEGVGLCSYLLISFWYTRIQANKAAIKALVVNRVADLALTIGLVTIFFIFKSLDVHIIFSLAPFFLKSTLNFCGYNWPILTVICSLLFIGAMGKSAQIGLHTWLPDAMEGPTPVSALIHAATMVTAGVFLIIKCSPLFEYVPTLLSVVTFIGATTAFFSATIGLVQSDIKKVIAYSTCSQLGYMIFACGLSAYHVSLFHLANHAFFKALLFLSAGAIIHSIANEQDMRKFGSLGHLLPLTSIMFLVGSLSLMGFPFLTGFYSKDLIIELALTKYTIEGSFAYNLGLITALFTSYYSFRIFYLTFVYRTGSFRNVINHVHELPWKMAFSLSILSFGSIFLGYLAKDLFIGLGTDFWSQSILILPENNNQIDAEFFDLPGYWNPQDIIWFWPFSQRWFKLLPFFLGLVGIMLVHCLFWVSDSIFIKKKLNDNIPIVIWKKKEIEKVQIDYSSEETKIIDDQLLEFILYTYAKSSDRRYNDIKHLLELYTPEGLIKEVEQIGYCPLPPYSIDSPFTPDLEVINKYDYYYYQQILIERQPTLSVYFPILLPQISLFNKDKIVRIFRKLRILIKKGQIYNESAKKMLQYLFLVVGLSFEKLDDHWRVADYRYYKFWNRHFYGFLFHKWYFDALYNEVFNRPLLQFAYKTIFRSLDKGVLEIFGPYGFASILFWGAKEMKKMQSGQVYYYAYFMFCFLIITLVVIDIVL